MIQNYNFMSHRSFHTEFCTECKQTHLLKKCTMLVKDLFAGFWNMAVVFGIPKVWFFKKKKNQNRAARFVISNYS